MSENNTREGTTRRQFLSTAATVAAASAVSVMPTTAEGMRRVLGANDRIHVGHVGLGGQGMTHLRLLHENATDGLNNNTEQIAVCDLYVRRKKAAQKALGLKDSQAFDDYRKLMEVKEIDAVWVTTSDQWHADVALAALEAGKNVYVEKPMCKTMEENFKIYDMVKRTGKILQVGSQGCTDQKWHVAGKVVKSGKIGKPIMGQGSYCRNSKIGEWNTYIIDPDAGPNATGDGYVNWKEFQHTDDQIPWDPDRFFRWRKYWAYGTGVIGDLIPHRLHPLVIALGADIHGASGWPIRVSSLGGLYVQKINPETHKKDREVPDFTNLNVDLDDETSIMVLSEVCNEQGWQDMVRGNKATCLFGGSGVDIRPERVWADEIDESTEPVEGPGESIPDHEKNFLDCIRTNGVPNANIDLAVRVQVMISLGELSYRKGKTMHFDSKTRKYWS